MKKYGDDVIKRIIQLYSEGKTASQIASELNVSPQYVNLQINRLGIKREKLSWEEKTFGKDHEQIVQQIKDDYSSGVIMRNISEKYNCNLNTIRRVLREAGLSPSGRLRAIGINSARERDEVIAEKKRQGLTYDEIVAELGVSRAHVRKVTLKEGIPVKRSLKKEEFEKQVRELYDSGMDTNMIAHKLNTRRRRVCTVLGVPFRSIELKERNEEIVKLIADGMDVKEVAEKYNLSLRFIHFIIDKHDKENS